jgi:hypothetical protein
MKQIQIDYQGGLLQQFPVWMDCVRASVYGCGRQLKAIAADLDMSVSELSRKLADRPADNVNFPVDRLDELVEATGDQRPVLWLVERFLDDPETRKRRAVLAIEKLLPELQTALRDARGETGA